MKKILHVLVSSLFLINLLQAQVIPEDDIIPVCDNQSISVGAPGNTGIYNLTIPCNEYQPLSPYMDFYYLKILSGSTFTFIVTPVGNDDYDFGAWKNPNWNNIGATPTANKRGSQNDPTQTGIYTMGLSLTATDLCETGGSTGYPEPGMVRYFDVQAGDEILIAIDRWSTTSLGYTIEFGGDAILDCTVLGNSYGKCDVDNNNTEQFVAADFLPDLQQEYPNHNFKFYATQTLAENNSTTQINFPLTVQYNNGDPTEIFVRVETTSGSFVRILKIFLFVNKTPELINDTVDLPLLCDETGDGQATFNLTLAQPDLINNPADFIFKYYTTLAAANAGGNNNIPNPGAYQSGNATIYVRIESGPLDGNEEGCFSIGEVNLLVSDFYVEEQVLTFDQLCDDDGDGFVIVDLTENISDIVDDPSDYLISYHLTQAAANNGTNPIANPEIHSIAAPGTITIYVRIQSLTDDCYSVSRLIYNTVERPVLNILDDVELCDEQQTGTVSFDLTQFAVQIVINPSAYSISYYESMADAQNDNNPIGNPGAYAVPVNNTVQIFIRVESNNCFNIGSVNIRINSNPLLNDNLEIGPVCDEDGNGTLTLDLTENETYFIDNPQNFQITYHNSAEDADTGNNPIANPEVFNVTAGTTVVVYIRVKSTDNDCYSVRTITISTTERPVLNQLDDVELCDEQQTGTINYDLTQFAAQIVANPGLYEISYYTSFADAENGNNPITNPTAYPVPINTGIEIFIKVDNDACFDIGSVNIQINSNPDVQHLTAQAFCTNQQTGTIFYDLTQHQSEWVTNPQDFDFEYYPSMSDLENGTNLITNPTNYEIQVGSGVTVYIKIINPDTECYTATELELFPGATATLYENLNIELCDENFDNIFEYNLSSLNAQLVANTNGLTFAYFNSEQNAIDNQNPIPESEWNPYLFNNLPAQIWVVATSADNCRSVPVVVSFTEGESVDLINTVIGPAEYCQGDTIDLTIYESEITSENGVVFSYHQSLNDAQNGLNPIANTTAYHPQGNNSVYVRVEQAGRCSEIAEIKIKLLPTPDIEVNSTLVELCPGDSFTAIAESSDPNPVFEWFLNGESVGFGAELNIIANGSYTVVVTGEEGCTNEETIVVVTPPSPEITGIELGQNYIQVTATAGGGSGGILEYSLDKIFWQSSPRFDNLVPGESYTVYVRQNGCMIDSYEVALLFITNFISPNGDGINDTWEVRGIEVTPTATLKIFDRYGKIFVDTKFGGNYVWTGKYMGASVASGDYWYIIEIPGDGIIKDRRFVGHVSVRNQ